MYTSAALSDLHGRTHRSLERLIEHCAGFPEADLDRELEGFGTPTVREQLLHLIGAERYWVGVLRGEMLVEDDPADAASLDALRAFRERIAAATEAYLRSTSDEELNTRRVLRTWGGREQELMPAQVIVRTQTHVFQHMGKAAAQCRRLGRPVPTGLDFPLD